MVIYLDLYSHVPWAGMLLFAVACTDEIMQLPKMLPFALCLATTMLWQLSIQFGWHILVKIC